MQKLKISISRIKSHMMKKSTVFNFLLISQLIQKVLQSNFSKLVLNIHIFLYKNSKILFQHEKLFFKPKMSNFFSLKCPKVRPLLEYLSQAVPKVEENKVFWIYLNFSKMVSAAMSVDVSQRQKKRISVYCRGDTISCRANQRKSEWWQ